MRWRAGGDIPPAASVIGSPYDADAHDARKGTTAGAGYNVQRTETCDDDAPGLITHGETTSAPIVDAAALPAVHQPPHGRALLPAVQLVDAGYLDAPPIVAAREDHAVARRGPARPDSQWPARAEWLCARYHPARRGG